MGYLKHADEKKIPFCGLFHQILRKDFKLNMGHTPIHRTLAL